MRRVFVYIVIKDDRYTFYSNIGKILGVFNTLELAEKYLSNCSGDHIRISQHEVIKES